MELHDWDELTDCGGEKEKAPRHQQRAKTQASSSLLTSSYHLLYTFHNSHIMLACQGILNVGVERNRKQETGSFQELLELVPAAFSPSHSAGHLLELTICFK